MGEPADLTDAERDHLIEYSRKLVDAVRNDVDEPAPRWPDGDSMDESTMIFKLAQLVLDQHQEHAALLPCLVVGNGGPYQVTDECVHVPKGDWDKATAELKELREKIRRFTETLQ